MHQAHTCQASTLNVRPTNFSLIFMRMEKNIEIREHGFLFKMYQVRKPMNSFSKFSRVKKLWLGQNYGSSLLLEILVALFLTYSALVIVIS